jgi:hypothetical protein
VAPQTAPDERSLLFCEQRDLWGTVVGTSAGPAVIRPDGLIEATPELLWILKQVPGYVPIPDQFEELDPDDKEHVIRVLGPSVTSHGFPPGRRSG